MNTDVAKAVLEDSKMSLTIIYRKLDRYENILINAISGAKEISSEKLAVCERSVDFYRAEASKTRGVMEACAGVVADAKHCCEKTAEPELFPKEAEGEVGEEDDEDDDEGAPEVA